eukprot:1160535-Pelagomonas_calceolata.AAC.16
MSAELCSAIIVHSALAAILPTFLNPCVRSNHDDDDDGDVEMLTAELLQDRGMDKAQHLRS